VKASILKKLETMSDRVQEIEALLAAGEVTGNSERFRDLSREYSQLEPIASSFRRYLAVGAEIDKIQEMVADTDPELRSLAQDELRTAEQTLLGLEDELGRMLLPSDPNDNANIFLEIRAGTGGDEAALFAGDLFRMYSLYGDQRHWQTEVISSSEGEHGGYKEIILRIAGRGVYSRLKFESGAHRVQRVPETESQGRIHTSTCTVAVLPEVDEIEHFEINPTDLKVDTYRASGAGGQHVNKTDSAVRITHLPSGIVVECQDERSQHKNRARALSLLQAKLLADARDSQQAEQARTRKLLVGTGERSERIRTYNFPQGRVTDHRINLTLYKLESIMAGNLDGVIEPLISEYQAEQLATLGA